jgi:hypothetical protein
MDLINTEDRQFFPVSGWMGSFIGGGVLYSFAFSLSLPNPRQQAQKKHLPY